MRGLPLAQFQFDYDQTWAAMFLTGDGMVLARYGGRSAAGPMATNSLDGLGHTMRRALEAFQSLDQPGRRDRFTDKRGPSTEYDAAENIPAPIIRAANNRQANESCIHCHNVYDAQHELLIEANQYDPRKQWKYPPPEAIGLTVDAKTGTRITTVHAASPAATAGIQSGDELDTLNGQAILSLADVQFALHHVPEPGELAVVVKRGNQSLSKSLRLAAGWRESDISWRVSMYGMPPKPGLWVQELSAGEKRKHGVDTDKMALLVKGIFGAQVRKSALKKGDLIVGIDGQSEAATEGQFHANLRLNYYRPGSKADLRVQRDGTERTIAVKF